MRSALFTILAFFLISNAVADTEPNDDWQSALTLPKDRTITGIQSDEDWYVINAALGTRILIDLTFTHDDGNIDIDFWGDDFVVSNPTGIDPGLLRDRSAGTTSDHEFIDNDISVRGPGAYYIRVFGADAGNSYTLTWTELATVADDGFEENDDNLTVKPITENMVTFGAQADPDWYSIEVGSGNTRVLASLRFYNTDLDKKIDLGMSLHDTGGTEIAVSTEPSGQNEAIKFDVVNPGTYHLQVFSVDNGGDGYALNWAGVSTSSSAVFPLPAVNVAPVATANTVTTTENTAYTFAVTDFTFSDNEGDSLVSATLNNLSLGGGSLTHSGGTAVNNADTLSATQLATLVYTPPVDSAGSPLATFDFAVNDIDTGTVAAQMSINVTEATATTPASTSSSSGAVSPIWLLALMLAGLLRRKVF